MIEFIVDESIVLLDFLLSKGFSKNFIDKNKRHAIFVNNQIRHMDAILIPGDVVMIKTERHTKINPIEKPLDILFEDDFLLIVHKEKGLPVIGTKRHYEKHLSGMIVNYYRAHNILQTVHFVNRLDLLTEGIVVVAKDQYVKSLMAKTGILKRYEALVQGFVKPESGVIENRIEKSCDSVKRIVANSGKLCQTEYKVLSYLEKDTLVEINLLTGRTHQIRVAFASIGHPLVGDVLYDENCENAMEFYLKSKFVSFIHPITSNLIEIED